MLPRASRQAGYSGTPLVRKLGLRAGSRVVFVRDPPHFAGLLGPLPDDVVLLSRPGRAMDYVHFFTRSAAELQRRLPGLAASLAPDGCLWISWPKKTSPLAKDLDGNGVRRLGLASGLVDVKVCAVDEDWSGLKFVRRKEDR